MIYNFNKDGVNIFILLIYNTYLNLLKYLNNHKNEIIKDERIIKIIFLNLHEEISHHIIFNNTISWGKKLTSNRTIWKNWYLCTKNINFYFIKLFCITMILVCLVTYIHIVYLPNKKKIPNNIIRNNDQLLRR